MATADPLILLRQAIKEDKTPIPTTQPDAADSPAPEAPLSEASHLQFVHGAAAVTLALDTPTRFVANDRPFDLRSIYFGWLNRNIQVTDYHSSASELSRQLAAAGISSEGIRSLGFVERVELITWLESPNEESEFIKPVAGDVGAVGRAGAAAGAAAQKGSAAPLSNALGRSGRGVLDPRLAAVYNGERRMGDRNSVLRGTKPTDFSQVRKLATQFVQKKPPPGSDGAASGPVTVGNMALSLNQKHTRRVDPIILLSPSASSLLRMSNARSFLEGGTFVPPDSGAATANLLHVSRLLREVDPTRPLRFVLVEGTEQFKPEYWDRVVAVFTTGQTWQFKSYRWSTPAELFKRIPGVYLGWRGDQPPELIRGWGQRVLPVAVDRWREAAAGVDATRFRDKEAVEQIWRMIEINMLSRGWRRDSGPVPL